MSQEVFPVADKGEDPEEQTRRQQRGSRAQISLQHQTLFEGAVHRVSEWRLQCCHVPRQGKRINKEFFTLFCTRPTSRLAVD